MYTKGKIGERFFFYIKKKNKRNIIYVQIEEKRMVLKIIFVRGYPRYIKKKYDRPIFSLKEKVYMYIN